MTNFLNIFINQQLTDVKIILKDKHKEKIFSAHKIILSQSEFFYKLFTFNNNNNKEYLVEIIDVDIAYDIISSLYGKKIDHNKNNKCLFKMLKIRDYFGLKNDKTLLYNLKVSGKEFE